MEASPRKSARPLIERLWKTPHEFSFFQAVRLLLRSGNSRSGGARGRADAVAPVWFRSPPSLSFPASEIASLEHRDEKSPHLDLGAEAILSVAFMGLAGHGGPLPDHYTELLLARASRRDYAFLNFLAIFNHRLIDLFYRAWEKPRFYMAYERGGEDPLERSLYALMGLGSPGIRRTSGIPSEALVRYAGLLTRRPVSLTIARFILADYFGGVRFEIEQFSGRWVDLDEDSLCRLGVSSAGGELGRCAPLGTRIWDVQGQIKVRLGPLSREDFTAFSPGGRKAADLANLLKVLTGGELDVAVELSMAPQGGGGCCLGDSQPHAGRLGVTSWLGSSPGNSFTHQNVHQTSSWSIGS